MMPIRMVKTGFLVMSHDGNIFQLYKEFKEKVEEQLYTVTATDIWSTVAAQQSFM